MDEEKEKGIGEQSEESRKRTGKGGMARGQSKMADTAWKSSSRRWWMQEDKCRGAEKRKQSACEG